MLEKKSQGGNGGGGADIDIISSRNTIEVSRSGDTFDVNVANEDSRNFFVKNFHEFMDAVQTIANLYIAGDTVGNVIQLLGNIDMTAPTVDDEANYLLSNGDYLIDLPNKTYNFRQYLRYTKIVSYGAKRVLQLLHPNAGRTAYDTWQLNIIRLTAENIGIGGDIAAWIDEFKHGDVSRSLPCEFQRYLFSSPGNVYYDLRSCNITCAGASQTTPNAFNPLLTMDNTLNAGLWVSAMYLTDCRFIAGRSLNTPDPNLNAPIVINSNWFENRRKILQFKQMSKEVNDTVLETGAPDIQIRTDNVAQAQTTWRSHQWEVTTDGTALVSCSAGEDCIAFAPKLALNDLYLQGTPLTPPGNPPTENFVSLVDLLQNMGGGVTLENTNDDIATLDRLLFQKKDELGGTRILRAIPSKLVPAIKPWFGRNVAITDSSATDTDSRILMLADVTTNIGSGGVSRHLFSGLAIISPTSDSAVNPQVAKINMLVGSGPTIRLWSDSENISPCIIYYNYRYYLSVEMKGKAGNLWMLGEYTGISGVDSILYYSSAYNKWYSDEARQTEVTFSVYASSQKFPVSVSFGGTSSQVVAGDGTFLNWSDKLGYWVGQTVDLPPVGSRDANKLYITTDY